MPDSHPATKTQDLEVLSQLIDDEAGDYRVRAGDRVNYIHILGDVFDEDTMCRPHLLLPALPKLPPGVWTQMTIERDRDGSLSQTISWDDLPAVTYIWHSTFVDVLSLKEQKWLRSGVKEVLWGTKTAISKIACFGWQIPNMNNETSVYHALHDGPCDVAPNFLAHLTENGRVIGVLLEKLEGRPASIADLPLCTKAVETLHKAGIIHGDVNRFNFMINDESHTARLVDYEHAEVYSKDAAETEISSLPDELMETTGRGGSGEIRIIDKPD